MSIDYAQRISNRCYRVGPATRADAISIAKEADVEIAGLTASLASAQQRIAELERALGELVAVIGNRHYGRMPDVVQHAYDAARAIVTPTRPSKGFLKGESPQATWPFAQDDKGTVG